jgi:hypothetical protein
MTDPQKQNRLAVVTTNRVYSTLVCHAQSTYGSFSKIGRSAQNARDALPSCLKNFPSPHMTNWDGSCMCVGSSVFRDVMSCCLDCYWRNRLFLYAGYRNKGRFGNKNDDPTRLRRKNGRRGRGKETGKKEWLTMYTVLLYIYTSLLHSA